MFHVICSMQVFWNLPWMFYANLARQGNIPLGGNGFFWGLFQNISSFLIMNTHFNHILSCWFTLKQTTDTDNTKNGTYGCLLRLGKCLGKGGIGLQNQLLFMEHIQALTFPLPKALIEVCAKEVRNPICVVYNSVWLSW